MQEFMLLIRNEGDSKVKMSPDNQRRLIKSTEDYIGILKKVGRLVAAHPFGMDGVIISGKKGEWNETLVNKAKEVQVGYYHIRADTIEDAIIIAKGNPEFEFNTNVSIEVRPVKS